MHHESKSGLPTDQIFCAADVGGTIYFGGGKRNDGALFAWDTATRGWRVLHWPGPARDEIANGMRVVTMGGELFVRTFSTQAAVNPKTDTWRDLSGYLGRRQISSSESLVAGSTLWCWGSRNFTKFDLATMTHRPVTPVGDGPAVTGEPGFLAETADCVWAISHDDFLDFRPGLNIHRLFAANKSDGTVQAAILLPMVCRIRCAVVVGQTLWLGVARGQSSNQEIQGLPCLVRVPLPR